LLFDINRTQHSIGKDNVLKEQYEKARGLVIRFHVKDKETPKSISDLTGLPLNEVMAIINTYDGSDNN
jgi:hypothetical protein